MAALHDSFAPSLAANQGQRVEIATADGNSDAYVFAPSGDGPWPVVVFFMDGPGIRPSMFEMSRRLADQGYYVFLPNLFYRSGDYEPFDVATVFANPDSRERLMKLIMSVNQSDVVKDLGSWFSWLDAQPRADAHKVGTTGYCMGGGQALNAAAFYPDRVKAAAAFHAGRLANDQPTSPHLQADKIKAKVYIGVAGIDHGFSDEEKQRLIAALEAAGTNYELEVYEGAQHGFAVPDMPVFDADAAEKHWQKLLALYAASLK